MPSSFKGYKSNKEKKAACERYVEKIIEAVVDLSFIVIKAKNLNIPEEDKEAFDILAEENIISKELSQKLKEAKGMRNILAHEYGKVDDKIVYKSLEELEEDVKEFLKNLEKRKTERFK